MKKLLVFLLLSGLLLTMPFENWQKLSNEEKLEAIAYGLILFFNDNPTCPEAIFYGYPKDNQYILEIYCGGNDEPKPLLFLPATEANRQYQKNQNLLLSAQMPSS